jgi:hypothetical protein
VPTIEGMNSTAVSLIPNTKIAKSKITTRGESFSVPTTSVTQKSLNLQRRNHTPNYIRRDIANHEAYAVLT